MGEPMTLAEWGSALTAARAEAAMLREAQACEQSEFVRRECLIPEQAEGLRRKLAAAEAERDGLAAALDGQGHSTACLPTHCVCAKSRASHHLARIRSEAAKAALLRAADEWVREWFGEDKSNAARFLRKMAEEAAHAV